MSTDASVARNRYYANARQPVLVRLRSLSEIGNRNAAGVDSLLDQMKCVRSWLVQSVRGLGESALLTTPPGSRNNILWNFGHVITDQCNMIYTPCGLASPLPASYNAFFDPGTSPTDWPHTPAIKEVIDHAIRLAGQLESDAKAGKFESYSPLALDDGIVLQDISGALSHCNLHEAMHSGVIMTLRKQTD